MNKQKVYAVGVKHPNGESYQILEIFDAESTAEEYFKECTVRYMLARFFIKEFTVYTQEDLKEWIGR